MTSPDPVDLRAVRSDVLYAAAREARRRHLDLGEDAWGVTGQTEEWLGRLANRARYEGFGERLAVVVAPLADSDPDALYPKYRVEKIYDPEGKHAPCRYLVLDPQHDEHAVTAIRAYADAARTESPALARDLDEWVGQSTSPPADVVPMTVPRAQVESLARARADRHRPYKSEPYGDISWAAVRATYVREVREDLAHFGIEVER